jgi:hypothetical protein
MSMLRKLMLDQQSTLFKAGGTGGSVGGSTSENRGKGQSKGKGRGGRGRGHGQVIVSDEEPAPALRRGACRT